MARKTVNRKIDSCTARLRLEPKREPYWTRLERGLALGYRRTTTATGTWIARRYDPAAKPTITYEALGIADDISDDIGLNFDAAQKAAREWFGKSPFGAGAGLTVAAAFRQYVAYLKREKSPSAVYNAEGFLLGLPGKRGQARKCTIADLHDVRLADLTKAQLQAWQDAQITAKDKEGQRRQKDTANRKLNDLKAALTLAADNEDNKYPAAAPRAWERLKPFEDVAKARSVHLKPAQMKRLLNAIGPGALQDLVYAAFLTGIRPGREMRFLTVGAFDPDSSSVALATGKTGSRVIYINSDAVKLFTRLTAGRKAREPMFLKDDGKPWGDANEWLRPLKEAAERVGLPVGRDGVSLYTARHSFISDALIAKQRVPIHVLAENCGTSPEMIKKNYAKFAEEDRRRFIEQGTVKLGLSDHNIVPARVRR